MVFFSSHPWHNELIATLRFGTARHHEKLLAGIDSLEDVGCFGLTELGYGNNAVEMETTAVYDKAAKGKTLLFKK